MDQLKSHHLLDSDIKNELLELANQVTETPFNTLTTNGSSILNEKEANENSLDGLAQLKINHNNTIESTQLQDKQEENYPNDDDDDLIDDIDFKLPEVDWINLEAKLKEAQQEINLQNKRANFNCDRDEIRRKLAIVSNSSSSASSFNEQANENVISDYLRRTNLSKNSYLGQNLQICFMNESGSDDLPDNETNQSDPIDKTKEEAQLTKTRSNQMPCSFSVFSFNPNDSCDSFLSQHLTLQNETKKALAQVQLNVKLEMELESKKIVKKPSPIADIVGLSTYGVLRLEREHIVDMNIGQLQVIANDLCNQIEKINEELKNFLIVRDDLYMTQDALLVDIEDVTKRIQEYAVAFQKKNISRESIKFPVSSSANSMNDKPTSNKTTLNSTNPKNKLFQLSQLTNKLFRFNKK